jgi:glc operon protein GlcG
VEHDKVNRTFGKRGPGNNGVIADAPVKVSGNLRTGPGEAEVHENEIDVFYVVDGGSTMVTGGKVVGGKNTGPGQIKGSGIEGGHTYHLTKGDVMVIPAGVPHWHKEVTPSIAYYTVKVYVGHEKVAATFGKRGAGNTGAMTSTPVKLVGNQRNAPGEAEVHENVMDVFWVMDGSSTIVTGGTLVGGKMASPGELKGTGIQGGQTQLLTKGDVMLVPAGTPHWHKDIPKSITYFTVKVPKK